MNTAFFALTQIATLHGMGFYRFEIYAGLGGQPVGTLLSYEVRRWFYGT